MMRDTEKPCPYVSEELLEYIEESFPMKDFGTQAIINDLMHHYGQRSVVRFLRSKFYEQQESVHPDYQSIIQS